MDTFYDKDDEQKSGLPAPIPAKSQNVLEQQMGKRDYGLGMVEGFRANQAIARVVGKKQVEMASVMMERQADELRNKMALELDLEKKKSFSAYQAAVSELNANIVRSSNDMELHLLTIIRDDIEKLCDFYHDWLERIAKKGRSPEEMEEQRGRAHAWFVHTKGQVDGKIGKLMSENTTALKQTLKLLNTSDVD